MPVYHNKMINRMLDMRAWPSSKKNESPMDTFVPHGKKNSVHLSHDLIFSVLYNKQSHVNCALMRLLTNSQKGEKYKSFPIFTQFFLLSLFPNFHYFPYIPQS